MKKIRLFSDQDFKPSLEELEIEKLVNKTEEQHGNLEFEDLFEEIKEQIDRHEQSTEKESESAEGAAQTPDSLTEDLNGRVSGKSFDTDHLEPSDTDSNQISSESLREIMTKESSQLLYYSTPGFENYSDQDFYNIKPTGSSNAWSLTKDAFSYLGFLGVKLTTELLPKVLKQTFKGILYAFTRLAYGLMIGIQALDQYVHRRVNSFNNLRSNIHKAQQALDLVEKTKSSKIPEGEAFKEGRYIRQMAIGDSIELDKNLIILEQFIASSVDALGVSIKQDLNAIRTMISYSRSNNTPDVSELLKTDISIKNLKPGFVSGFSTDKPFLTNYHTSTVLPGNVVMIAQLPNVDVKTREEWIQAYRDSQIFLGVDKSKYREHESIPFRSTEELKTLLVELERLCLTCIKHQAFYESMKRQKLEQRIYYRNYFENLMNQQRKVSIKDSLIDLVTLKNHFIDKVYLPAAIDMHDFCVRVINSYLKYIEKNIRVLTP